MRENKRCGKYTRKHIQRNIKGIINFSEKNVNRVVEKKNDEKYYTYDSGDYFWWCIYEKEIVSKNKE